MDIQAPFFTINEMCSIAGIKRGLANVWMQRGWIEPTRADGLALRNKSMFSIIAICNARILKILTENNAAAPSASLGGLAAVLAANPDWMFHVARNLDKGRSLKLLAALTRSDGCWQSYLGLNVTDFDQKFGPETAYTVLPIGVVFEQVYRHCEALLGGRLAKPARKGRRARS